jgi:nuclear protein localization family protein 4
MMVHRVGKQGWTLIDMLADFHLLLFLCDYLDIDTDMPIICQSVLDRSIPLVDGYVLLIKSIAGVL